MNNGLEQWISKDKRGIWRYERLLPKVREASQVTLGEGMTAMVNSSRIARYLGLSELWFKLESGNPTGSYKDRISAMGVSWAVDQGKAGCIGTSSGNAGASVAAYAVRSGLRYELLVLEDIAEAKLLQAALHDAQVKRIKGLGVDARITDQVFEDMEKVAEAHNLAVMITAFRYNPIAMEAVKTIVFELAEESIRNEGRLADAIFVPVGGGGLYTGIWEGCRVLEERGWIGRKPQLAAVQADGSSSIARAWLKGSAEPEVRNTTSRISGLQVANPPDGKRVLEALNCGDGFGVTVSDEEIWLWQERLASWEGILCEPAAAASVAGVERAMNNGQLKPGSTAVCLLTGAGYKDNERLRTMYRSKPAPPLYAFTEWHTP